MYTKVKILIGVGDIARQEMTAPVRIHYNKVEETFRICRANFSGSWFRIQHIVDYWSNSEIIQQITQWESTNNIVVRNWTFLMIIISFMYI